VVFKKLYILNRLVKKTFNLFKLDISKLSKSPIHTLLGQSDLQINSIIDVGANEGQFAKYILKKYPDAHLYCFEPLTEPFERIKRWAKKQKGHIDLFNIALGDKEGSLEMFHHVEHSPSSSILRTTKTEETLYPFTRKQIIERVKMKTLDKVLLEFSGSLKPDILIKLDVQGYEDHVIKGSIETFRKAKACIMEVNLDHLYENQATFRDLINLLYNLGYSYAGNLLQAYAEDGHVIFIDALFLR